MEGGYDWEAEKVRKATKAGNVAQLRDIATATRFRKIAIKAHRELFFLAATPWAAVRAAIGDFRGIDSSLIKAVNYCVSQRDIGSLMAILNDLDIWSDVLILLEQFTFAMKADLLSKTENIILLKRFGAIRQEGMDSSRRSLFTFLTGYCKFKVNRYPERQLEEAKSAAAIKNAVQLYPEEHKELLIFLADHSIELSEKFGFDPELHGDITCRTDIDTSIPLTELLQSDLNKTVGSIFKNNYTVNWNLNKLSFNQ